MHLNWHNQYANVINSKLVKPQEFIKILKKQVKTTVSIACVDFRHYTMQCNLTEKALIYLVLLLQSMLGKQESCDMPSSLHYTLAKIQGEKQINSALFSMGKKNNVLKGNGQYHAFL